MQELIALSTKTVTVARNDFVKVKGSIDTNVYHIEEGSVRIYVLDGEEEQIIRFGYKGDLVVCLDSYLTGMPSDFTIQAIKKTTIRVVTKAQIEIFLNQSLNTRLWSSLLENLILQQLEREIDILTSSSLARYRRVLKRSPQLFQEIPHRYIANYLRMSPETLSRLKSLDLDQDLSPSAR
jgi:CRP-like cAMP-binding protein